VLGLFIHLNKPSLFDKRQNSGTKLNYFSRARLNLVLIVSARYFAKTKSASKSLIAIRGMK